MRVYSSHCFHLFHVKYMNLCTESIRNLKESSNKTRVPERTAFGWTGWKLFAVPGCSSRSWPAAVRMQFLDFSHIEI
jgi:hypothetical protein